MKNPKEGFWLAQFESHAFSCMQLEVVCRVREWQLTVQLDNGGIALSTETWEGMLDRTSAIEV